MKKFKISLNLSDDDSGHYSSTISSIKCSQKELVINILIIDLTKKFVFETFGDTLVYELKKCLLQRVESLLVDAQNYSFFIPPTKDKLGKFLDDSRLLSEYFTPSDVFSIEFIKKSRQNIFLSSPLHFFRQTPKDNREFIKFLKSQKFSQIQKYLDLGFDPNFLDVKTGQSPLHMVLSLKECRKAMSLLIIGGAHKDIKNREGLTPLHLACKLGNVEIVKEILDFGQSPNVFDNKGLTPTFYSMNTSLKDSKSILKLLLYNHVMISIVSCDGMTEIHHAAEANNTEAIDLLITYGADVNARCSNFRDLKNLISGERCIGGDTPLHIAARLNHIDAVRKLLARGADPSLVNSKNESPADIADKLKYHQIIMDLNDISSTISIETILSEPDYNPNRKMIKANPYAIIREILPSNEINYLTQTCDNQINHYLNIKGGGRKSNQKSLSAIRLPTVSPRDYSNHDILTPSSIGKASELNSLFDGCSNREALADFSPGNSVFSMWKYDDLSPTNHPHTIVYEVQGSCVDEIAGEVSFGFLLKTIFQVKFGQNFTPTIRYPSFLQIKEVLPGSNAEEAGLKKDDFVISINNIKLIKCTNVQILSLFKLVRDLKLTIVIVRHGATLPRSISVNSRPHVSLRNFGSPHEYYARKTIQLRNSINHGNFQDVQAKSSVVTKDVYNSHVDSDYEKMSFDNVLVSLKKSTSTNSFHSVPPLTNCSFEVLKSNHTGTIMNLQSKQKFKV